MYRNIRPALENISHIRNYFPSKKLLLYINVRVKTPVNVPAACRYQVSALQNTDNGGAKLKLNKVIPVQVSDTTGPYYNYQCLSPNN